MSETLHFLYQLKPARPELLTEGPTDREAAVIKRHFDHLRDLRDRNVVLCAGRTLNQDQNAFGIVIFEAASETAARTLMASDPAVEGNVMRATLFPFRIALSSGRPRIG
jgi:uncharacterized protein